MLQFILRIESSNGEHLECVLDYDDLMGIISGRLSEYTRLVNPADPLSVKATLKRTP